jgi:hypothetical protein
MRNGLHWSTRHRLELHVDLRAGQPSAQHDAVQTGLVRRSIIASLYERSDRAIAGHDLVHRFERIDVTTRRHAGCEYSARDKQLAKSAMTILDWF